jgi:adenylate cyclase
MESHGRIQIIQITRSTCELIKDVFDREGRGVIDVKGAGEIEVWCAIGRKRTDAALVTEGTSGRQGM